MLLFSKQIINQELSSSGRMIEMVGEYNGVRKKTLFFCQICSHKWDATPEKVRLRTGCPVCAKKKLGSSQRLSKTLINDRLAENNRTVRLLGEYVSARTTSEFICLECSNVWMATPDNVCRAGTGCPSCCDPYFSQRISKDAALRKIKSRIPTIDIIGEYHGYRKKTIFQCQVCDHTWVTTPAKIVSNTGCPHCAVYGFDPSKRAFAYIIDFGSFIKYGITNSPETRFSKHRKQGMIGVIELREYEDGKVVWEWERQVKNKLGGKFVSKEILADGFTETLPKEFLSATINLLP